VWQALYEELKDRSFMVIAVALDSREGDPVPWIEAAKPTYLCLIDRDHRLAALYHMVNVPQAVWIDEHGTIVRPAESAGAYEGFRQMDRVTRQMPEDAARITGEAKAVYVRAIRDWVLNGAASEHAFDAERARARVPVPTEDVARAHVAFRLGQHLIRCGQQEEGDRWLRDASRLHPESWCMWRQRAGVTEHGLASQPDFWARVDALGERRYYAPVEMRGMPT
jgi:hypothetical protein